MTLSNKLTHQVIVSRVDMSTDVPTRVNIKKRRENVVYRTVSHRDNINLAYVLGNSVVPLRNMAISDRSISLYQNRLPFTEEVNIINAKSFDIAVERFLLTDIFTTETPTKPKTPLFYNHTLKYYNDTLYEFTRGYLSLLLLEFADEELHTIPVTDYILETASGRIYNNLESSYNSETGAVVIYFIKYTVRNSNTGEVTVHHELLNNEPIYSQADFEDLDDENVLLPNVKKYLIELTPFIGAGSTFLVTLPVQKVYAYKEETISRIRVTGVSAIDTTAPWYLNITNGSFVSALRVTSATYQNHKYYIAEFNTQLFNPYPPYKIQAEQKAIWITPSLIKVPKNIAHFEEAGLFIDVIVKSNTRETKLALTTDPDKKGLYYNGTIRYTEGISSVDCMGGFIELTKPVRTDDEILVSYFTEEKYFEFTGVDLNPIHNVNNIEQRLVVYINPETNASGVLDRSLHYLVVNTLGEIIYASQTVDNKDSTDPATQKLLHEDFYSDGSPRRNVSFYYDKPSTDAGLENTDWDKDNETAKGFSFIDKYTTESVLFTMPNAEVIGNLSINFQANSRFLVLADIYIGNWQPPSSLSLFDIRVKGGGIKEENREEAIEKQPEVNWYWDFTSNAPYPPGGFYIEVPKYILEECGGNFSIDQVREVIQRHMKLGGYAVIRSYGIDPVIIDVEATDDSITIEWPSYGSNVTYHVYFSRQQNKGFIRHNSNVLVNNNSGNIYVLDALDSATKYFIYITAIETGECESKSQTIEQSTEMPPPVV